MNPIQQISPQEAFERITQGAVLIDVREQDEFDEMSCAVEHVIHAPMSQFQNFIQTLPKDKEYITICYSGGRSFVATQLMSAFGFTQVSNLSGGISSWRNAGLPMK